MEERKGFGTNFGFLMAAVGSAVGKTGEKLC